MKTEDKKDNNNKKSYTFSEFFSFRVSVKRLNLQVGYLVFRTHEEKDKETGSIHAIDR